MPTINPGYRSRPVVDVIEDIQYDRFRYWWQRKVVWFWDDNLTADRFYVRDLLAAMIPLRKWWLTQASMDIGADQTLLDLMKKSGCIGIFFGIESFGAESLKDARKPQNRVSAYKKRIRALHDRGICVMAGFIAGFDGDTPESIAAMAKQLYDIGVDVPFLSVADALSRHSRLRQTRGGGEDPGRARLGILQRVQRVLPTARHVARAVAEGASGIVARSLLAEIHVLANRQIVSLPALGSVSDVRGDERVLLPETPARERTGIV